MSGWLWSPPIESSPWLERNPQGPQRHLTTCPLRLRSPLPSVAAVCRGCAVPVVAVPVRRRRRRRCRVLPPVAARLPPLRRCGCGRSVAAPLSPPVAAPLLSLVAAIPPVAVARGVLRPLSPSAAAPVRPFAVAAAVAARCRPWPFRLPLPCRRVGLRRRGPAVVARRCLAVVARRCRAVRGCRSWWCRAVWVFGSAVTSSRVRSFGATSSVLWLRCCWLAVGLRLLLAVVFSRVTRRVFQFALRARGVSLCPYAVGSLSGVRCHPWIDPS